MVLFRYLIDKFLMTKKEWKQLDDIAKVKCKEDAGWKCEICGKGQNEAQLHWHHYIGRTHTSLRWVLQNSFCLCAAHHTMGKESAHEDPQWFDKMARDMRGEIWYKEISQLKNQINKKTFQENLELMDKSLAEIKTAYGLK